MSQPNSATQRGPAYPVIPSGITVATFNDYVAAKDAVDKLAGEGFPVQQVSIIGDGLKSVERVTGRMSWGRAALSGLVSGLWFGFFIGLLMVVWAPTSSNSGGYLIIALMMGAAFGILTGVISYAVTRNRQNFTSIKQVVATSYVLIAAPEVATEAMRILGTTPSLT